MDLSIDQNYNPFKEVIIINKTPYKDNRGFFFETYNREISNLLDNKTFVQDNHSLSAKNVLRGLHYQWNKPMGKLVRAAHGHVIDVFVDIRKGSDTLGKHGFVNLTGDGGTMVWIPPGFAHGFYTVRNNSVVLYKCSEYYNNTGESGINPLDTTLNIKWPTEVEKLILSEKDRNAQSFKAYKKDFKF